MKVRLMRSKVLRTDEVRMIVRQLKAIVLRTDEVRQEKNADRPFFSSSPSQQLAP